MAFALPVWLAVQEELLGHEDAEHVTPSCFDQFDDEALFQMFHLTRPCIAFITDTLRLRMKTLPLNKPSLTVDAVVMVALNYYAHGVSATAVLHKVGLSQAECCATVSAVSGVIAEMSEQFISFPLTQDARASVARRIERVCGIPGVLGVLAAAHFKIRASPYDRTSFRSFVNTAGYTSVVNQIICDSDGNILSVGNCSVGSTFDQDMWTSSLKGTEIEKDLHGPYWVIGKMTSCFQTVLYC